MNRAAPARLVLDTQVVLDLLHFVDPRTATLRALLASGQAIVVSDAPCRDEFVRVLRYPVFGLDEARCVALEREYEGMLRGIGGVGARDAANLALVSASDSVSARVPAPARVAALALARAPAQAQAQVKAPAVVSTHRSISAMEPIAAAAARAVRPLPRCTDPDDQKFLELAARARATALVSRDRALLALARRCAREGRFAICAPEQVSSAISFPVDGESRSKSLFLPPFTGEGGEAGWG